MQDRQTKHGRRKQIQYQAWEILPKRKIKQLPRGVLRNLSDRDDRMGAKIKTRKNPQGFKQNLKKSLDQHLTPQKSHAEFPSHKNFQGALNDITQKIETLVLNTPKNPKKYLPKFSYPKNSQIENFKPQNPFDHPCHL